MLYLNIFYFHVIGFRKLQPNNNFPDWEYNT